MGGWRGDDKDLSALDILRSKSSGAKARRGFDKETTSSWTLDVSSSTKAI